MSAHLLLSKNLTASMLRSTTRYINNVALTPQVLYYTPPLLNNGIMKAYNLVAALGSYDRRRMPVERPTIAARYVYRAALRSAPATSLSVSLSSGSLSLPSIHYSSTPPPTSKTGLIPDLLKRLTLPRSTRIFIVYILFLLSK